MKSLKVTANVAAGSARSAVVLLRRIVVRCVVVQIAGVVI